MTATLTAERMAPRGGRGLRRSPGTDLPTWAGVTAAHEAAAVACRHTLRDCAPRSARWEGR